MLANVAAGKAAEDGIDEATITAALAAVAGNRSQAYERGAAKAEGAGKRKSKAKKPLPGAAADLLAALSGLGEKK
jgi:hypothetical protein